MTKTLSAQSHCMRKRPLRNHPQMFQKIFDTNHTIKKAELKTDETWMQIDTPKTRPVLYLLQNDVRI